MISNHAVVVLSAALMAWPNCQAIRADNLWQWNDDFHCQKVTSALFFGGSFLTEGDEDAFQCRLRLPDDKQPMGVASEGKLAGQRVLFVSDLAPDTQVTLIHVIVAGARIVVETIPWT